MYSLILPSGLTLTRYGKTCSPSSYHTYSLYSRETFINKNTLMVNFDAHWKHMPFIQGKPSQNKSHKNSLTNELWISHINSLSDIEPIIDWRAMTQRERKQELNAGGSNIPAVYALNRVRWVGDNMTRRVYLNGEGTQPEMCLDWYGRLALETAGQTGTILPPGIPINIIPARSTSWTMTANEALHSNGIPRNVFEILAAIPCIRYSWVFRRGKISEITRNDFRDYLTARGCAQREGCW